MFSLHKISHVTNMSQIVCFEASGEFSNKKLPVYFLEQTPVSLLEKKIIEAICMGHFPNFLLPTPYYCFLICSEWTLAMTSNAHAIICSYQKCELCLLLELLRKSNYLLETSIAQLFLNSSGRPELQINKTNCTLEIVGLNLKMDPIHECHLFWKK